MITRRFIAPDDWEFFPEDRLARRELGYCHKETPAASLPVDVELYPRMPPEVALVPLTTGIAVMISTFFVTFPTSGLFRLRFRPTAGTFRRSHIPARCASRWP